MENSWVVEDVIFPIVWGCGSVECRTLSIMKHGTDEEWLLNDIHNQTIGLAWINNDI